MYSYSLLIFKYEEFYIYSMSNYLFLSERVEYALR